MIITDNAKPILLNFLKEEGKSTLTLAVLGQRCHAQLYIDAVDNPSDTIINGIPVIMGEQTKLQLEDVTLDANENGLIFHAANSCHGCQDCEGDCDHDDDDHCCCDGHCCGD